MKKETNMKTEDIESLPVEPLISINRLAELIGSRATVYHEINAGRLQTVRVKRRRFATPNQYRAYLQLLERESETQK